jgi:transcriptional regulator with XRE-family HTH domain
MDSKSFGKRLAEIRKAVGYGKDQVGFAKLYGSGKTTWSGYENDKAYPDASVIIKICKDWNLNPRWLIKGTGEMFESDKTMGNVREIVEDLPLAEILEVQHLITDLLTSKLANRNDQQ